MSNRNFEFACLALLLLVIAKLSWPASVPVAATGTIQELFERPNYVMRAWQQAEGADPACNNPLNTTLEYGTYTVLNSHGVKCYAHPEEGLEANVRTLSHAEYVPLVQALQAEDGAAFVRAIAVSRWGTDAGLVQELLNETLPAQLISNPIATGGDSCGYNVRLLVPLLQDTVLAPGQVWSFNQATGNPALLPYEVCAGVPGGNWCNLAARFAQTFRGLGLEPVFQDHGIGDIGGGPENSVAIWNDGGEPGGQDLQVQNTLNRPVHFWIVDSITSIQIAGEIL